MPRILICLLSILVCVTGVCAQDDTPIASIPDQWPSGTVAVLELQSGDRVSGTLLSHDGDSITIEHDLFGRQVIPATQLTGLSLSMPKSPAEVSDIATEPELVEPTTDTPPVSVLDTTAPAAPSEPEPNWDWSLELGGTFRAGNTEDQAGRLVVNAARTSPSNTLRLDAGYRVAARDGDRTENRVTTGAYSEWPRQSTRWSTFAQGRYDIDEFQSWDSRLTASGGVSYHFIDDKTLNEASQIESALALSMRVGAGVRQEFGSLQEDAVPEGVLGANLSWTISPRQRMNANSTFFPDLDQNSEYRVVSNVDWSIDLDHMDGISLKLGVAHEFESTTDPGIEENDVSAYATLVLDF